ncbi:MAG: MFS transporter [Acidobacteriaceae bacterium]|nr:MFS transporter [Acidobacteriaceae bacterium]
MAASASAPSPVRPSSPVRRWLPAIAMLLLSFISYVDRSVLSILSPTILADLHLSAQQYGEAILVFSLCYMAANPIWGWVMDRKGLFWTCFAAVGLWSLASGSHAMMTGLLTMSVFRGVLGFGEGATFPAGLKTVSETLPAEQRSFGLALAYSGGSLGAALTPLIVTPLAIHYGWRAAFVFTAVVGALWLVLWLGLRIAGIYPPKHAQLVEEVRPITRWNRDLFATAAIYGLGAAPLAFGLYATPLYLSRVLHVSQASLGHMLWVPPAGWEVGYLVFGRLSDLRRRRTTSRPFGVFLFLMVASFLITVVPMFTSVPVVLTLFFLEMFFAGGFVVFALAVGASVQPKQNAAFLAGFSISSWALLTGLLLPWLGRLFDQKHYSATLWIVSLCPPVGVALWQLLRRTEMHQ